MYLDLVAYGMWWGWVRDGDGGNRNRMIDSRGVCSQNIHCDISPGVALTVQVSERYQSWAFTKCQSSKSELPTLDRLFGSHISPCTLTMYAHHVRRASMLVAGNGRDPIPFQNRTDLPTTLLRMSDARES